MGKASREQSARERLREQRKQQEARGRLMRRVYIGGAAVVVIALVVGIGIFVQNQRATGGGEFTGQLPAAKVSNGAAVLAKQGVDKPVVDVYEDFRCPHCAQMEERSGDVLKQLVAEGKAKVVYHPVAVIDQASVTAGAAALCSAGTGKFMRYHDLLFENSASGFTAESVKEYANEAGIDSEKFQTCLEKQQYTNTITQNTKQASKNAKGPDGQFATPTLTVNGEFISSQVMFNPDRLKQAVLGAE